MVWTWVTTEIAMAAHAEQLAQHGGGEGVRDAGLVDSAIARAQNLAAYGDPDAAALAATYAYGIARNHPFVDGNKRTAAVVSIGFLRLNGYPAMFDQVAVVTTFLALAAGEVSEDELAAWLRSHIV